MLTHIHIRDFTIIDQLELDLKNGMTVLTGETGAGKSIIIDALNLVLGDRADSGVVRHGCTRTDISATFDISAITAAHAWLAEHELDAPDHTEDNIECVLRRTVTAEGRSKGYINGTAVPIQSLQTLGDMLVDIHGQHEHQSLLKNDMQRQLLDDYAGHADLLAKLAVTYRQWKKLGTELELLLNATQDRDARLDMLRYQVHELETLGLNGEGGENEVNALEEERTRLANSGRLLDTCQTALHNLYESDANDIFTVLGRTLSELEQLRTLDNRLSSACDLLNSAHVQIEESANELRHYRDTLDLDPARLSWVEQRLDVIHQLARKHRIVPTALTTLLITLSTELSAIEHHDEHLEQLQNQLTTLSHTYFEQAHTLSASRTRAAQEFSKKVTAAMQPLGLTGAHFDIALQPLNAEPDADTQKTGNGIRFTAAQGSAHVASAGRAGATATGVERVDFLVSTNPGQPLKPLSKVASGGELSRISLAIQVIAARSSHIPTLIFDEVDTGIGGGVAETVGRQLRALGESHQVLCVTHLPQVAALGHHHLHVSKESTQHITTTRIHALADTARNEEIARMLGGVEITAQTRAHAKEMIGQAKKKESAR